MSEDLLKILGIIAVVLFLLYVGTNSWKLHINMQKNIMEGLTNNGSNGIGGSAGTYATTVEQQATVLQDSLLIKKYKTDYENVIINMEEYLGLAMLETALQFSPTAGITPENLTILTNLNTMNAAKQSLNSVMTVVDQHA
uniref:Uncharacterized protein n=1 Tax=viral metagenome TaxID=1070528 RepID=A0A6C0BBQ1_9ZZZZ